MPLGFPSHQGLLAPLWRRWPDRFSIHALWVGAIVPDVIDGTENIVHRGHFQQWIGHSLLGALLVGVPVGLLLTAALRGAARRCARLRGSGVLARTSAWAAGFLLAVDNSNPAASSRQRLRFDAFAVWVGAWSHVAFDLPTHERARLLWPFADDPAWLGAWWSSAWFRVSAPGYPDYPIGPHFVAWLLLSAAGIVMFCRWPPRRR
jgi:membrane-bound metal-dependent hydrolase YbcI (DUF457 family)